MFSIFSRRSLKDESCSMEMFDSLIVAVWTAGMLIPPSFLLFVICKYTKRFWTFSENTSPGCERFAVFFKKWNEFSVESMHDLNHGEKFHGTGIATSLLNSFEKFSSFCYILFFFTLGVALTGTCSAVLAERKKLSTETCGLYLLCEKKQATCEV